MGDHRGWIGVLVGIMIGVTAMGWPAQWVPKVTHASVAGAGTATEMIAFTSDSLAGGEILYVLDAKQKVLCIYEYDTRRTKLKLTAVRHLVADQQLQEFNNEAPFVSDIENLIRKARPKNAE